MEAEDIIDTLDDDEITAGEAGFVRGYFEERRRAWEGA